MNTPGGTVAGWWDYNDKVRLKARIPGPRDRHQELAPSLSAIKRYRLARVARQLGEDQFHV